MWEQGAKISRNCGVGTAVSGERIRASFLLRDAKNRHSCAPIGLFRRILCPQQGVSRGSRSNQRPGVDTVCGCKVTPRQKCESVVQDDALFPFLEVCSRRLSAKLPAPVSSARVGTEQATAVVAANGTHIATRGVARKQASISLA